MKDAAEYGHYSGPGVQVTLISSVPSFAEFFSIVKTRVSYSIFFMIDMCPRSSAVVTPVKYECDSKNLTRNICKIENYAYGEINEWSFRNPHRWWQLCGKTLTREPGHEQCHKHGD